MSLKECIDFANGNPVCFLGSVDNGAACVRGMLMDSASEDGFVFALLTGKQVSKQIHENADVEVCFYNNPPELGDAKQLRVRGKAEFVSDEKVIAGIREKRAFLDDVTGRSTSPRVEPFIIRHGKAQFWGLKDAGGEDDLEWIDF